jgi:hypothetical protein
VPERETLSGILLRWETIRQDWDDRTSARLLETCLQPLAEQTRLLELLASAESLDDILTIEARLSEVTYELERYASRLRNLSNQVDYATVNLTVTEVEVLTPMEEPTVWQRISTGFSDTLSDLGENLTDLFVWVIVESPNILIFGLLITLIVFAFRKARGYRTPRKPKTPPQNPSE